jgi:hypothetical protein
MLPTNHASRVIAMAGIAGGLITFVRTRLSAASRRRTERLSIAHEVGSDFKEPRP